MQIHQALIHLNPIPMNERKELTKEFSNSPPFLFEPNQTKVLIYRLTILFKHCIGIGIKHKKKTC